MKMQIMTQCLAHGRELLAAVMRYMRMGSQETERQECLGDFGRRCGLGKSPLDVGSRQ